jgi:tRNA(Arg) A34 adenosine deaminase TadA
VNHADAEALMRRAIALSRRSLAEGGGPFGALVVRGGTILFEGTNRVTQTLDPTAHAEVVAIRGACRAIASFSLAGCEVFSSCEPCPMCLAAAWWARVDRVWFGNTRADAAAVGFDDDRIYAELARPLALRELTVTPLLRDEALVAFREWSAQSDRTPY